MFDRWVAAKKKRKNVLAKNAKEEKRILNSDDKNLL